MAEFEFNQQASLDHHQKPIVHETTTEVDHLFPPQLQVLPTSPSSSPDTMTELLDQAPEVLHNMFQNVDVLDLASLSRTCRHLNSLIKNDELLWKLHYLALFVRLDRGHIRYLRNSN